MQASSPLITLSPSPPSFNSYSSNKLAEIAARVVQEFSNDQSQDVWQPEEQYFPPPPENQEHENHRPQEEEQQEEEFEFAVVCREPVDSPISADDAFYNGQIRPVYPLFNTALLLNKEEQQQLSKPTDKPRRLPLRKLFSEERESSTTTSCSSSEADDLENVPAETYCVWTPKKAGKEETVDTCKKSSSTGTSSKRWKFRDLIRRSNSDGDETFVFLAPKKSSERRVNVEENGKEGKGVHVVEERYVKSKAIKDGDQRRSFLPYRQDLVGLFSNLNGLSRNLHPL